MTDDELEKLIDGAVSGTLTDAEFKMLDAAIAENDAAARNYLEAMQLHTDLLLTSRTNDRTSSFIRQVKEKQQAPLPEPKSFPTAWRIAAAAALAIVGVVLYNGGKENEPARDGTVARVVRVANGPIAATVSQVKHRIMTVPYRVLFSNDTTNILTCKSPYHAAGGPFRPKMFAATVDEVAGTGVDVHILQPGFSWVPWYNSQFYTRDEHRAWFEQRFPDKSSYELNDYWVNGGDLVGEFVAHCRQKKQPRFISMRLNHNPFPGREEQTSSRFFDQHPEYYIGDEPYWTLDWSFEAVREHRFTQIREICEQYDLDGFELDFMRFPIYFEPERTDAAERRYIMTNFVARVRELLDRTAEPGQQRWLCVRVPSELVAHDILGIDLRGMVAAGVDMINLSCYYFTQQQNDLAAICAMVPDAAVYNEITYCSSRNTVESGTPDGSVPTDSQLHTAAVRRLTNEHQIYTTAHLAYQRGAAGVSFFNFVYYRFYNHEPPFHVFAQLNDPKWLAGQPQWYFVDDHGFNYLKSDYRGMLPIAFAPDTTHELSLDLAPNPGLQDGLLRLMMREDAGACDWSVSMNGTRLEPTLFIRDPLPGDYPHARGTENQYACFACPVAILRDGNNHLRITQTAGPEVTMRYLDLVLPGRI